MTELRVLLLADDPLVRASLARALETQPSLVIVGQDSTHADPTESCELFHPDVVLWDAGWAPTHAESSGIADLLAAQAWTLPPVVVLLPDGDGQDEPAARLRDTGAAGLIRRTASAQVIAAGLAAAFEGLVVMDRSLLPGRTTGATPAQRPARAESLTPRELEVLQLVAEGLANKQIAQRLAISEHTVKFHINSLMGKLGAASRTEAVARATRSGLVLL